MARGFGATLGAGTTDKLKSSITAHNSLRSYGIWTYRNGEGGGGFGSMFRKRDSGETVDMEDLRISDTSNYSYQRRWNNLIATWTFARPAANEWHHILITYDSSSSANDPIAYVDGSSTSVTETGTAPSGTIDTNTSAYWIGNREAEDRVWDGSLAEFTIWNAILTADEAAAVGKGVSPLTIRPMSLIEYIPLYGPTNSYVSGATTLTGTLIQPHPRIHSPARRTRRIFLTAAGGSLSNLIGGKLTNSLLLGGLVR